MNQLPLFYYDFLARITPGAFTLATLAIINNSALVQWLLALLSGGDSWKAVVIPLALLGFSYVIGTVYESLDSAKPVVVRNLIDDRAFRHARDRFYEGMRDSKRSPSFSVALPAFESTTNLAFRTLAWEKILLDALQRTESHTMFLHCHRFQAEYKLFLHLVYPAMLSVILLFYRGHCGAGVLVMVVIVPFLLFLAYRRDERRWWQVLMFGMESGWLGDLAETCTVGHKAEEP